MPGSPEDDILGLTKDLCGHVTGVVAPGNGGFFARLEQELPLTLHRFRSGLTFNGWIVPRRWSVRRAEIRRGGSTVFDGLRHPLAVAVGSKSFQGTLDWEELRPHLVTSPQLPDAYLFHWQWQYRPWQKDWALCVPYRVFERLGPGTYDVDLVTGQEPGEMIVGESVHGGRSEDSVVFTAHTCHPCQANDDAAGVAVLVRLFQWLHHRDTYYTYRLVLGPEHLGPVFYLHEKSRDEIQHLCAAVFLDMPGTPDTPLRIASTFLGNQGIDQAIRHAAAHYAASYCFVGWREGAGNDETVWEAPGYEIPCVEVSRARKTLYPFAEYHTSLDTPDRLDAALVRECLEVLKRSVEILEGNATLRRRFSGLICLSNPVYDLYLERRDPAVEKNLTDRDERWGRLLDSLLRYLDGSMTVLDIARRHHLPFDELLSYLKRFEDKGLLEMHLVPMQRPALSPIEEGRVMTVAAKRSVEAPTGAAEGFDRCRW